MTIRKPGHTVRTVCRLAVAGALTLALSTGAVLTTTGSASASKVHAIGVVTPPAPPDRLEPASFREVHAYLYPDSNGRVGGYVSCPPGMKAVTGGATAASNSGSLSGLTPTYDGNGWYASAAYTTMLDLEVICTWPEQLSSVATLTGTVQGRYESSPVSATQYRSFRGCPDGQAVFGGGAFPTKDGVIAITPTGSGPFLNAVAPLGNSWINGSAQAGSSPPPGVALESYVRCIDPFQLGTSVTVTTTQWSADSQTLTTATAFCPSGHTAYTGGAYWTTGHGSLRLSHVSFNRTAWTAQGYSRKGYGLQVEVRCIRTDQVATPPVIATLTPP